MTITINNLDVENLLEEVVRVTGESKTEAVRKALEERYQRLSLRFMVPQGEVQFLSFLEDEVWSQIPIHLRGTRLNKAEEERILGYEERGV